MPKPPMLQHFVDREGLAWSEGQTGGDGEFKHAGTCLPTQCYKLLPCTADLTLLQVNERLSAHSYSSVQCKLRSGKASPQRRLPSMFSNFNLHEGNTTKLER